MGRRYLQLRGIVQQELCDDALATINRALGKPGGIVAGGVDGFGKLEGV